MNKDFVSTLNTLINEGRDLVIVTLIKTRGSAPQIEGAKIIVGKDGLLYGTVGGGKVETQAIAHAQTILSDENSLISVLEWNLQTDVGMTCGGVVTFTFEKCVAKSSWEIAVFGAGHVAQELIRLLVRLDCSVTCIDPRSEWLSKLPDDFKLKKVVCTNMETAVSELRPGTFIVSMTMGHAFDLPILTEVFKRDCFPYIGAIGSKSKAIVLKRDLINAGLTPQSLEKLICPIGEEIGNNTPAEIAISVVAQMLKHRDLNES